MQAKTWQWGDRGATRPPFWRKALTLAIDYGEPIVRLAQIPGSFVPGLDKALDKIAGLTALYGADLNIAPLDGPDALKPIDGVAPPATAKGGDGPVFFDGVEITTTAAHNKRGKETIVLERIDLCVIEFVPGKDEYFAYGREGEAIIGAGFLEPMRFFVELEAKGPRPARRQLKMPDGKKRMLVARGANFLDTDEDSYYSISPNDPPQVIKITVNALDAGYYDTCLRFFYRVDARELRQYTSDHVRLYTDGA
jgi:hypothetical protein